MFAKLFAVAQTTFTETLRQPIYAVVVFLTWMMLVMNVALSAFSLEDDTKLLLDLGLSTLLLSGLLLAAFCASGAVSGEIEDRTVPDHRQQAHQPDDVPAGQVRRPECGPADGLLTSAASFFGLHRASSCHSSNFTVLRWPCADLQFRGHCHRPAGCGRWQLPVPLALFLDPAEGWLFR